MQLLLKNEPFIETAIHPEEEQLTRFGPMLIAEHWAVMIIFSLLVVTGVPQSYPGLKLPTWIVNSLGGIDITRIIHRISGLAFSLLRLGDHSEAIGLFETSLKSYGPDPLIFSNLGYAYRLRGDIRSAVRNYERARELSPGDPERHHELGFALYLARDYAAAVEPFRTALEHRPDWGLAHYNLAMTYWNLRRYAQALTHARHAQERGIHEAHAAVRALTAQLSLGPTRSAAVHRRKQ